MARRQTAALTRNSMSAELSRIIDEVYERRAEITPRSKGVVRQTVKAALALLDSGKARVAEPRDGGWHVNQWLKKAGFRAVPGAIVRRGAYIAPGVVLMPSFVNLGAYVAENTMVDTWATVGSCAQIGKNCHISGGAGIGGVLEPLQAGPVVIEDDCFIGARAEVAEGVIVRRGSVLSMGVYLGASTKIVERATGKVFMGEVPPYSVVVSGTMPGSMPAPSLYCAVIVKRVDEKTRAKTSINELLRD